MWSRSRCWCGRRRGRGGLVSPSGPNTVQGLFELLAWLEMGFAASGDVDDFASARVAGGGLGFGVLDFEDAEASDFNAVALNKSFAHSLEKAIDHLQRQIVLASNGIGYRTSQIFLGYRSHKKPLSMRSGEDLCKIHLLRFWIKILCLL